MPTYTRPYLYPKQESAFFTSKRYAFIEASTKAGKSQPLNAVIYTPRGPTTMGQIKPGDYVLGLDGYPTKVLATYPQGLRDIFAVEFSDGTVVECDAEHLWEIHNSRYQPTVVSTKELAAWPDWRRKRSYVPLLEGPAQFREQPVPLDPYLIGFLIGDGNLTTTVVRFSSEDPEIIDFLWGLIPPEHEIKSIGGCDYHITASSEANRLKAHNGHITGTLKELGLMGKASYEKSIPSIYLYNTVDVRVAMLQGLMDSDGSVNKHGQPIIEQSSYDLSQDIITLVQSLGGSVLTGADNSAGYWTKEDEYVRGRTRYRQVIRLPDSSIAFRLARKQARLTPSAKSGGRMIRDIRPIRKAEAQCIEVEDPRHLYLTDGFIPTHNTVAAIAWIIEQALKGEPHQNFWWVAPVSDQAKIAYTRVKNGLSHGSFTHLESPTPKITLANLTQIWFKSGDNPDSLYGEDVYAAVVDEASRVKEESWYALRSTLTATQGPVRVIGNVKGRKNWFYRLSRMAEAGEPNMHYLRITVLDAIAAGVIPQSEVEDAKRTLPDKVFRELYMAEPGDDSGNPFGLDHVMACARGGLSAKPPVAFGIDLAKKQDWLVVVGLDEDGAVCRFARWQGKPWRESIQEIHRLVGEDIPALVDSTGIGDPVLEELQVGHGNFRGYMFTGPSKQKLMEGLAVSIQGREICYPAGAISAELESFEYALTRTGVRYAAPVGSHDDCVCALALAREQWSTGAPAANLMKYYMDQAQAERARAEAAERAPALTRVLSGDDIGLGPEPSETLDNELTELYRKTLQEYLPGESRCLGCGNAVRAHRVSDGVSVWHPECYGPGAGLGVAA